MSTRAIRTWPASRLAALALAGLAVLLLPGSLVLDALTGQNLAENGGQDIIVLASCATVGLIIAWHRPANPIGWLILAGMDVQGLAIDGSAYVTLAHRPGDHLPVGPIVWLDTAWFLGIAALPLIILLFPDGAPPSARWRRVMWSYIAVVGCYLACNYAVRSEPWSATTPGSTPTASRPSSTIRPAGSPRPQPSSSSCWWPPGRRSRRPKS